MAHTSGKKEKQLECVLQKMSPITHFHDLSTMTILVKLKSDLAIGGYIDR